MPRLNVEIAQRLLDAHAAGDIDTFSASCDPDIEIQAAITRFEGTAFRGVTAYRAFRKALDEAWQAYEGTLERMEEIDHERVMMVSRLRAVSRGRIPIDQQLVWIMAFRNGLLVRLDAYSSVDAALEATGPPRG